MRNSPRRITKKSLEKPRDVVQDSTDPVIVSSTGDVILVVQHTDETGNKPALACSHIATQCSSFRVDSANLRHASPYFNRLLDQDKFGEGVHMADTHKSLKAIYGNPGAAPSDELPHIKIRDMGRISPVKSIRLLMTDFLAVLHGRELSSSTPPLANIANLVIVADRFDSLHVLQGYFKSRKLLHAMECKTQVQSAQDRGTKSSPEEKVRQRLLIGLFLDAPSLVLQSSSRLVHRGWVGYHEAAAPVKALPLWWDLPQGIEDELQFRRTAILETLQSVQAHFLALYTSRDRQCKLGYDNSTECDSYQLGQMIRFFKRTGTLELTGTIAPPVYSDEHEHGHFTNNTNGNTNGNSNSDANDADEDSAGYTGELSDLLDSLRQCPEYQIDKFHAHCGLRTRLMPVLDTIDAALTSDIGVCLACWHERRHEYSWRTAKRPLVWKKAAGYGVAPSPMYVPRAAKPDAQVKLFKELDRRLVLGCLARHVDARDMFLAKERVWSG